MGGLVERGQQRGPQARVGDAHGADPLGFGVHRGVEGVDGRNVADEVVARVEIAQAVEARQLVRVCEVVAVDPQHLQSGQARERRSVGNVVVEQVQRL